MSLASILATVDLRCWARTPTDELGIHSNWDVEHTTEGVNCSGKTSSNYLNTGHVFERRRKKELTKALAVYGCHFGFPSSGANQMASFLEPASQMVVRKWCTRLGRRILQAQRKSQGEH